MSDTQAIANNAASKCSMIFSKRPYGTDVDSEDVWTAEKEFAAHIQAACEEAVRACNSHDDLLAACEALADVNPDYADSFIDSLKEQACAAIAKAKGQTQ